MNRYNNGSIKEVSRNKMKSLRNWNFPLWPLVVSRDIQFTLHLLILQLRYQVSFHSFIPPSSSGPCRITVSVLSCKFDSKGGVQDVQVTDFIVNVNEHLQMSVVCTVFRKNTITRCITSEKVVFDIFWNIHD